MSSNDESQESFFTPAEDALLISRKDSPKNNLEINLDDATIRSLLMELKFLRNEVRTVNDEVRLVKRKMCDHQELERTGVTTTPVSRFSTPGSHQSPLCGEDLDGDKFNNAALAMILHAKLATDWQKENLEDSSVVLQRINSDEHYLTTAHKNSNIENKDGTTCNSYMNMFRKYLVVGETCSPAQGKQLHALVNRMFTRRDMTETGDQIALDPVRKEWTKFIGDLCFGKLLNPKIPRQTGVTNQDLLARIEIIAEKIRQLFFGDAQTLEFVCVKADGTSRIIMLPTKDMIQAEIKLKLHDKESSEMRYIRNHLVVFDKYEALMERADRLHSLDPVHERSRPIIQAWRENRKLKGHVVVHSSVLGQSKGHGKGKSKLFSYDCISTPDTSLSSKGSAGMVTMSRHGNNTTTSASASSRSTQSYQHQTPPAAVAVLMEMEEVLLDRVGASDMDEYMIPHTMANKKQKYRNDITGLVDHYKNMRACSDDEADADSDRDAESSPQEDEETQRDFDME